MVSSGTVLRSQAGYTITEALTVTAVIGGIVALALPGMARFQAGQEVQTGISQISGMLRRVRAEAIADGVPRLVLVQQENIVDGVRSPFALVVRDNDRSYSLTPPDEVQEFILDAELSPRVAQFDPGVGSTPLGASGSAVDGDYTALLGDYSDKMAAGDASGNHDDVLAMYEDKAEDWQSGGNPGCSGPGPCLDAGHADYEPQFDPTSPGYDPQAVLDLLRGSYDPAEMENGSTLPLSDTEGVPGLAFNERGIPVDLDSPSDWGSGMGGIYLTDNAGALYASTVSPLGEVSQHRYDPAGGAWR